MTKWLFFSVLALLLCGFTLVDQKHETPEAVDAEFFNVSQNLQGRQFYIYLSTPNFSELQDGEVVIVSSGTFNKLMFRSGQELYSVTPSCITVTR